MCTIRGILPFLLILGLPIMVMEFSVGRASKASAALSFDLLEPKGSKWHWYKFGAMAGNYLLMMFYTTIAGWMVQYFFKMASGRFEGLSTDQVSGIFLEMLAKPGTMAAFMIFVVVACFTICGMGLQKGVENIISFAIDLTGCSRKKAVIVNTIAIILLSLPSEVCSIFSSVPAATAGAGRTSLPRQMPETGSNFQNGPESMSRIYYH